MRVALNCALFGATVCAISAVGADTPQPARAQTSTIYRCRTADGANALVSAPDARYRDCVGLSETPPPKSSIDPKSLPTPTENKSDEHTGSDTGSGQADSQIDPSLRPHRESDEAHDARVKQMQTQLQKWCADHAGKKPKSKDVQNCVEEHMSTYMLLHP